MKKRLNIEDIKNELEGSVFFPTSNSNPTVLIPDEPKEQNSPSLIKNQQNIEKAKQIESKQEIEIDSNQASKHASINLNKHKSELELNADIIESIRKIVKTPAKAEVLYVRVSKEEKKQLGDIEYTYGRQDIDTSANELVRIAINFLIVDYKANGNNSLLAKVLAALNA